MTRNVTNLDSDYAAAGFDGHLPFGRKPVLLVVDVCRAYLDKDSPLYAGVEDALAANRRVIAAARQAGVPVVFTRVLYQARGLDGGIFYRKVPALKAYLPGNPLGDFPEDFGPQGDEVLVTKQYASAFFGTSLAATLTAMGTDTVLITGFSTSGCVRATALDALQNGFVPYVIREACGDRDSRPHDASLFDLQAKYAEVVGESEAIRLISRAMAG
jgi:maleamate amidohydrolase